MKKLFKNLLLLTLLVFLYTSCQSEEVFINKEVQTEEKNGPQPNIDMGDADPICNLAKAGATAKVYQQDGKTYLETKQPGQEASTIEIYTSPWQMCDALRAAGYVDTEN